MAKNISSSGGTGVCGLLLGLFIALKLLGVISWSWWWVLAPAWMPLVVVLAIWLLVVVLVWLGVGVVLLWTKYISQRK